MSIKKKKFRFLDSQESMFFERDLEVIKATTYDQPFPELKAMSGGLPISMEAGPAAATVVFRSFSETGMAKFVSNYSDDNPRVDIAGIEESVHVRSIGVAYGYSVMDIRFAAKQNISLSNRKAIAARRANEILMNKSAWLARAADPEYVGLTGLFYNPNITSYKSKEETGKFIWAEKTNSAIVEDINTLCNTPSELTNGHEIPNVFRCPLAQFTRISTTKLDEGSDVTILDWVKKVNPHILKWDWLSECKGLPIIPSTGAAGPTDIAIVYNNSLEKLSLEIPVPFEQFPPEARNLEFVINCLSRFANVLIYYPLSVALVESI